LNGNYVKAYGDLQIIAGIEMPSGCKADQREGKMTKPICHFRLSLNPTSQTEGVHNAANLLT
jgi:hypothetical protein